MRILSTTVSLLALVFTFTVCAKEPTKTVTTEEKSTAAESPSSSSEKTELATFAAGCFWCVEAVFESLDGVNSVVSGYTGGASPNPTYEEVCNPALKDNPKNHAEAIQIEFDPNKITYGELVEWFWRMHDPTTLNQQGADKGTQYRSAIYYHDDEQKAVAEKSKKKVAPNFAKPIVTQIEKASTFHLAEGYHQDYFRLNPTAGYCSVVIAPKLKKLDLDK